MDKLEAEFQELIKAARIERFEQALASSSLATVAAKKHPLNFVALRTQDDDSGQTLRLHLWCKMFNFGQDNFSVHDHAFHLESYIVRGALRQILYEFALDLSGSLETYKISYNSGGSKLHASHNRVTLKILREEILHEFSKHELESGVLHRLIPVTPSAITLVLTRPRGGTPIAIGPVGAFPSFATERSAICDAHGRPMTIASSSIRQIIAAASSTNKPEVE